MLQLSYINVHILIFFLFNFPITFLTFIFFYLHFSNLSSPLPFHLPTTSPTFIPPQPLSLPYLFISPLPSTLISFLLFPFIFLYFCLFLFTPSKYKFVTISSILCIVFPHKKKEKKKKRKVLSL